MLITKSSCFVQSTVYNRCITLPSPWEIIIIFYYNIHVACVRGYVHVCICIQENKNLLYFKKMYTQCVICFSFQVAAAVLSVTAKGKAAKAAAAEGEAMETVSSAFHTIQREVYEHLLTWFVLQYRDLKIPQFSVIRRSLLKSVYFVFSADFVSSISSLFGACTK